MNLINSTKTMSSLEIAKLTGKRHEDVLRDIRKTLDDAEIEATHFCVPYKMPSGQTATVYNLPKRECDLVVSGYSVKYRLAIIDRWQELEAQQQTFKVPQTLSEALLLGAELAKKVEQQAEQLALQARAVAYVENFVKCEGLIGVREAAKSLGLQQNAFVQMLIAAKIMFRENGHLQSYQSNIDAGYFTVKISKDINGKARSSTMFTAKGIRWVAKKLELDKLFID
jgi:phage antirepressor YoqD-like protein